MLCIAQQNRSIGVNFVSKGSPSRILRVLLISLGITILPKLPSQYIFLLLRHFTALPKPRVILSGAAIGCAVEESVFPCRQRRRGALHRKDADPSTPFHSAQDDRIAAEQQKSCLRRGSYFMYEITCRERSWWQRWKPRYRQRSQ